MWNIALEKRDKYLIENWTDTIPDKDPGFYNTKIPEGRVNLKSIR